MKKRLFILIIALILILVLVYFGVRTIISGKVVGFESDVVLTKATLPAYFEKQEIVQDLPDSSSILLKLYNFNTGNRQWEESYIIEKGSVRVGSVADPDIEILLHSKYIPKLADFCNTVRDAKGNGDFGFSSKMNKVGFLWKYKSSLKYRGCLGY